MVTSKLFSKREFKRLCTSYNSFFDTSFTQHYFDMLFTNYVYYRYLVNELGFSCDRAFCISSSNLGSPDKTYFRNYVDFLNLYLSGVITL